MRRIQAAGAFLMLGVVLGCASARGQSGFEAWFAPGEAVSDAVALRYKCRVVQNSSPLIIIIFGFNRLYGPEAETYLLENNLYSDTLRYTNGVCTTWPQLGSDQGGVSSIRSAIPDYNEHGWTGARTLAPLAFPKQTYEIDGIANLWKMDLMSQTNLTGVDLEIELDRGGLVGDLTEWNCAGLLDTNVVYREWTSKITFGGATYTNRFALPDTNGRYVTSYEMFDFLSEFLWRTTQFKAYFWDLELQREGSAWWRRVNQFQLYRQDAWPTNYGTRIVSDNGRNVIEMSNAGGTFFPLHRVFDLSVSLTGAAPDLKPIAFSSPPSALAGQAIPIIVSVSNSTGTAAGPFSTGYFLSDDADVALNDTFLGTQTDQAGLAPFASVTFTNLVTLPADAAPGTHYLGAIVDFPGVMVETIKTNNTAGAPISIFACLPSAGEAVTNHWTMPDDFRLNGWLFEDFPDTRPDGAPGGGTNLLAPLQFAGDTSLMNGSFTNEGPLYTSNDFFPFVMLDTNHQWLLLHPAPNRGASVGFTACHTANYRIAGAFRGANDAQFAGDGVVVAMLRNLDTTNLLFTAAIPSSAAIDPSDLFSGPGAAPFSLTLSLVRGETVRFVVFSGTTNGDIGFDGTALKFTATRDAIPAFTLAATRTGNSLLLQGPGLANESYALFSTTNFITWTPAGQPLNSSGGQISWLLPITNSAQFFRARLVP